MQQRADDPGGEQAQDEQRDEHQDADAGGHGDVYGERGQDPDEQERRAEDDGARSLVHGIPRWRRVVLLALGEDLDRRAEDDGARRH
jgi:hypothetical protein